MPIVFFGTPEFAVPSLKYLLDSTETVSAVVTRPDSRRARRKAPEPSAVKRVALERGIRVLEPLSMKDEGFINELKGLEPEFIVVVAYGKVLTQEVLDAPSIAPINLHASLLPKYRGSSPINWAIINGDQETGVTSMFIKLALDEGETISQEKIPIEIDDTAESLTKKLSMLGGPLLFKTLHGLREGTLKGTPQAGEHSYIPMLKKEDGHIDWSKTALEIHNLVRGTYPWPGAYGMLGDLRIKFLKVRPVSGSAEPGEIARAEPGKFYIGTGEGLLEALELQPENGRRMPAKDFMLGRKIKAGQRVS